MAKKGKGRIQSHFFTNGLYSGNNDVERIIRKAHKNKYHPDNK